ncbi:PD40 domain-containing protein [candidate division KSB1 bacterium]|nr:PD40 domain-containing protein [candidate division KSB1 bacterium]
MSRAIHPIIYFLFLYSICYSVEGRFLEKPDISRQYIVFSYRENLWRVDIEGGTAIRLTSHPGCENNAKISPDGKWVAFSGNYHKGLNVYLMPIEGGSPQRLTFRTPAQVVTWHPDNNRIIFRVNFNYTYHAVTELFTVDKQGHYPEKLPVPTGILCSFSPDGRRLVYNRRGREDYYWKGYKGGKYQDIWLYDAEADSFSQVTKYIGQNSYPMWIGDGFYFVSDREGGIANIFRYDFNSQKIEKVTFYRDYDVQMPSTDGKNIVFMHSGYLYVYYPATGQTNRINVQIPDDRWELIPRTINPKEYIHSISLSSHGDSILFEARGDIFIVPKDKKLATQNITATPGSRERYPQFSPDGKWVAFFSDKSGEYQLYIRPINGAKWITLTNCLNTTPYDLEWSPDGNKILFSDKNLTLYYVDVKTKKLHIIDQSKQLRNDEFTWKMSDYDWSPDSKWVVYSQVQYNRNSKIFLYHLDSGETFALTGDFFDNINPCFDKNGEYLYFLSYRDYNVDMDLFEDNHIISNPVQVMVIQLRAGQVPPFESRIMAGLRPFTIDLKGIQERIFFLPVKSGNYFHLKAGCNTITWASVDFISADEFYEVYQPLGKSKWKLHIYDMQKNKHVVCKENMSDWRVSMNGKNILTCREKNYSIRSLKNIMADSCFYQPVCTDKMYFSIDPLKEWSQIFYETWRWYRDFFYDPAMHGKKWEQIRQRYEGYLPDLISRDNLNWVLLQMVGELNVSHTYISNGDSGPLEPPEQTEFTGLLGVDLETTDSGFYRFAAILGPNEYSRDLKGPLARADIDLKAGHYLVKINEQIIKGPENPYKYLQVSKGEKVTITYNDTPTLQNARSVTVEPLVSERDLRYADWLTSTISQVLENSQNNIGYMHLNAMNVENVGHFDKFWRAFRYKKGLIIDVRGNRGGWTEYFMIDKLERKMVAQNCIRDMVPFRYPGSVSNAHLVLLTNEYNHSDGELFVEHFKARNLGTVIGTPSWGGLVGIVNLMWTVDNGKVFQSNNSFYGRDGEWLVENRGALPDIYVDNDPASQKDGRDKQLETAISLLLQKIAEDSSLFPVRPDYPVR